MIYVEEKSFEKQIDLLEFISQNESYDFVAWIYPESKITELLGESLVKSDLQPVTTYGDGFQASHTKPKICSPELVANIRQSKKALEKNCDSLILYKSGKENWLFSTIVHEGMSLVNDDELLNDIQSAGFAASLEAPSWW